MPFQTINGIRIYYEEYGQGFPLLLIQGLGYPSGMWFLQTPEFSRHFRTIVFDNRGVGKTDRPDEEYTVALMASDAVELLRGLGITRAHVAGVSLGGYIAQDLALSQPDMVDYLVLMATSCGGPQYLELTKGLWEEVAALAGLPAAEIFRRGMALAATERFVLQHPEWIERSVAIRLEKIQPFYAFQHQSEAAMKFDSRFRAQRIHHPTLILAGSRDRVMPLPLTEELAQKIPGAHLKIFPDAAHLLFLEEANEVNRLILEFLAGNPAV
jgi:pimeloyl-ACP methyl ester carboxylesterase